MLNWRRSDLSGSQRRLGWHRVPEESPEETPPASLAAEWLRVRREVELAMDRGLIPGSEYVYDPRLDALRGRIRQRWADLSQPLVLGELLELIATFQENVPASIFGYAFLRTAYDVRNDSYSAEYVAHAEVAYMNAVGIESHPSENPDVVDPQPTANLAEDDDAEEDDL